VRPARGGAAEGGGFYDHGPRDATPMRSRQPAGRPRRLQGRPGRRPAAAQLFGTALRTALPFLTSTLNSTRLAPCSFMMAGVCLAMVWAIASGVMPDTSWLQLFRAAT